MLPAKRIRSSGFLVVSSRRVGDCRAWPINFRRAAAAAHLPPGVGMGENQSISSDQVQKCLGSDQVKALAVKMGIDPDQASNLLAEFLPKVVDKLTPTGKVDPAADHQQGLAALIPSLLQSLSGSGAART